MLLIFEYQIIDVKEKNISKLIFFNNIFVFLKRDKIINIKIKNILALKLILKTKLSLISAFRKNSINENKQIETNQDKAKEELSAIKNKVFPPIALLNLSLLILN